MFGAATLRDRLRRASFRMQLKIKAQDGATNREPQFPSVGAELDRLAPGVPVVTQLQRLFESASKRSFERVREALESLDAVDGLVERGFSQLGKGVDPMMFDMSIVHGLSQPEVCPAQR